MTSAARSERPRRYKDTVAGANAARFEREMNLAVAEFTATAAASQPRKLTNSRSNSAVRGPEVSHFERIVDDGGDFFLTDIG